MLKRIWRYLFHSINISIIATMQTYRIRECVQCLCGSKKMVLTLLQKIIHHILINNQYSIVSF